MLLEYESTRMHTFPLGLQAIVSRIFADSPATFSPSAIFHLTPTDYSHVQEVISSTLITLKTAIKLYNQNVLKYCPIRTFLHVTTASIYLLKSLGLGVSPGKLCEALVILQQAIVALKNSNPDDVHIGGRYATLLEMHMAKLKQHFQSSFKPHDITPPENDRTQLSDFMDASASYQLDLANCMDGMNTNTLDSNWLSLPLDSSLLSFGMENFQGLQCLGDDTLDFL